jgi:hypothetical protein
MVVASKQKEKVMSEADRIDHSKKQPSHIAYQVRDGKDDQSFWTRIGVAWATKDGKGYTIHLNAVPLDGKIVLRVNEPK